MTLTHLYINDNSLKGVTPDKILSNRYHPPYESFIEDLRYMFNEDIYRHVTYNKSYLRLSDGQWVTRTYTYKVVKGPKYRPFDVFELEYINTHTLAESARWFNHSEQWIRQVQLGRITKIHV